ncbi:Asp-tRNA(Asn)/Glu-tRNA(Gln) amidotransferase subunit GatC [Desulfolithobacter sp.]
MNITKKEVKKVARLARLELSDAEMDRVTRQLDSILGYVAKLDELDTGSVVPTTHTQQLVNAFRDDKIKPSLPREKALANAPRDNGECFVVPKVIT